MNASTMTKAPVGAGASLHDREPEITSINKPNNEKSQAPIQRKTLPRDQWFACFRHAVSNRRLSEIDFRLFYLIAEHIHRETDYAYAGQEHYAQLLGRDRRTIQRSIDKLVRFGYLGREVNRSRRIANRYWVPINAPVATTNAQLAADVIASPVAHSANATEFNASGVSHDDASGVPHGDASGVPHYTPEVIPLMDTPERGELRSPRSLPAPDVFNGKDASHGGQDLQDSSDTERPSSGEKPLSRRRSRRGPTPLAPDWQPNDAGWSFAMKRADKMGLGRDPDRIDLELEKFRSYYIGNDKHHVNWDATWYSWWLREEFFAKPEKACQGPSAADIILSGAWANGRAVQ